MSDPYECRSVTDALSVLEGGAFDADLSATYRDLVQQMQQAAEDNGGKAKVNGKIVITLTLSLENDVFDLIADAKATPPKRVPRRTVMYATPDGTLSRQHPQQMDAFLRPVDMPSTTRKA